MTFASLSLLAVSLKLAFVAAQNPAATALEPLASKHFTWPNVPYQVTGDQGGIRGPQSGFNLCNSTTQNQDSKCQTLFLNSLDDFCMWSSDKLASDPLDTIADSEAREVAWCTKPGHGTRVIPAGAITGAQFLYAKNYLQVVGFIDQTQVHLTHDDEGGELDPHGADEQGNPLGGIVFTNGFGNHAQQYAQQLQANTTPSQQFTQVIEWTNFIGGGIFCLRMCNPQDSQAAGLCQHIYDRIGCTYNAVADYNSINGTFTVCDSEDMSPPGVYTTNGATTTWFQPPEGVVPSPPYTPSPLASSNCQTFSSAQLYGAPTSVPAASATNSAGASSGAGGAKSSGGVSGGSGGQTSSGGATSQTGKPSAAPPNMKVSSTPFFIVAAITITTMIVTLAAL